MTARAMRHATILALAAITTAAASPASPADPRPSPPGAPARALPWLEVTLPATPAAGAATARLVLRLSRGDSLVHATYAGAKVSIGGAPPRVVPAGDRLELIVAASAREPLRLTIDGGRVLAHVHAGDTLAIDEGHDGGWLAVIGNRMAENAPKRLTVCPARSAPARDCPLGYVQTRVFVGDPVCKSPTDDEPTYKCVKAPVVRARGPLAGRAEVTSASASGRSDETDAVPLAPRPLSAKEIGPAIPVAIGEELMPMLRLGAATALLVVGPGGSYQVWLDDQGRVDSAELAAK